MRLSHNKIMKKKNYSDKIDEIIKQMRSETDPEGSYTGNPTKGGYPVQDADDL